MTKSSKKISVLILSLFLFSSCAKKIEVSKDRPRPGDVVIIKVREDLKHPLAEVVTYKKNMDWKYEVVSPSLEGNVYVFKIQTDTLASLLEYRVIDENDRILPEKEEGIVIFYEENKPVRNAYFYRGLIVEGLIPYRKSFEEKEHKKRMKKALEYYRMELQYYPDNIEVLSRIYSDELYLTPDEEKQSYLNQVKMAVDSILMVRQDLPAYRFAYNTAELFNFPEINSYYNKLLSYPPDARTLDIIYRRTLQSVRRMPPNQALATLEDFIDKYSDIYSRIDKAPQFLSTVYNWLYYISIWQGDTGKALNALEHLIEIIPYDPMPYIVKASLYIDSGFRDLEEAGRLLKEASEKFDRISILYVYPFYDVEERKSRVDRTKTSFYRVLGRYNELTGNLDDAIATYEKVIELQGGEFFAEPDDHMVLADLYTEKGDYNNAGKYYLYATVTGGDRDSIRLRLQEMLKKEGISDNLIAQKVDSILAMENQIVQAAPDFKVKTIEGKEISLSNFKGKVVVLNFWATWCAPCKREIPLLNQLVEKFSNRKDIVFVALTTDSKTRVENFLKTQEFKYLQAFAHGEIFKKYKVSAIPTHYIINKEGKIVFRMVGSLPDIHKILETRINNLLRQKNE